MTKPFQYALIIGIIFIAVIASLNLFKTSSSLKDSKALVENALLKIKETDSLLKEQGVLLDSLKQLSDTLITRTKNIDSLNAVMKKSIDYNFNSANKNLSKMSEVISNIHTSNGIH